MSKRASPVTRGTTRKDGKKVQNGRNLPTPVTDPPLPLSLIAHLLRSSPAAPAICAPEARAVDCPKLMAMSKAQRPSPKSRVKFVRTQTLVVDFDTMIRSFV